ncbi:alpha/beta fold hydrolase [Mycobacterium sp. 236(2023)]|uniref:alpha/beta hydrolase n=1 Tax=Mycobacterium sp. 236(2023) TaxID=3038163 RepID=UPI00241545EC|nr:alpha/beta fold hydrolase [Mycobacterium sp. 236(2023)]MDG4666359.1 alpha/beta fold hydrolase [Mycobacterium sp. 236(2023)]
MRASHDQLAQTLGRPVLVMAHGVGATADTGLHQFAEMLCASGVDVLAFDYRGFGRSGGHPRQSVSMRDQIEDYHAAVTAARQLPGVDEFRVALWGVSLAGGHVLSVAAQRPDISAVIALTPLVDGWAAAVLALRHRTVSSVARCTLAGVKSRISTAQGGQPVTFPIVAPPGHDAAINLGDAYERYVSLAGPSWCNQIDAAIGFELLRYRPTHLASRIRCPVLVQIGDRDRSAPPQASARAAAKAAAEVRKYDSDHFDVWPGGTHFDEVMIDQQSFLTELFASR